MSRADKIKAVAKQAHDNGDCVCCGSEHGETGNVTVTISREDAKAFQDPDGNWVDGSTERLAASCRAALEDK